MHTNFYWISKSNFELCKLINSFVAISHVVQFGNSQANTAATIVTPQAGLKNR
jgi:hypothetical protein